MAIGSANERMAATKISTGLKEGRGPLFFGGMAQPAQTVLLSRGPLRDLAIERVVHFGEDLAPGVVICST